MHKVGMREEEEEEEDHDAASRCRPSRHPTMPARAPYAPVAPRSGATHTTTLPIDARAPARLVRTIHATTCGKNTTMRSATSCYNAVITPTPPANQGPPMILNLTQHPATPEQREAGVSDLPDELRKQLVGLLTFDLLPSREEIEDRAEALALLADSLLPEEGNPAAMIGGAPYLMAPLEVALRNQRIRPLYAFSVRESVEQTLPDGTIRKTSIFRHAGFIEV